VLSAVVPALLVVAGTLLMAVVIFAPVRGHASVTVSYAPPVAHAQPLPERDDAEWSAVMRTVETDVAPWTALVDPCAAACDAPARLAIVDALAAVRNAWARDLLERAHAGDPNAGVRSAAAAALDAP
jgi:hypothetical protein